MEENFSTKDSKNIQNYITNKTNVYQIHGFKN